VVLVLCAVFPVTIACDRERSGAAPGGDTLPPPAAVESTAVTPDTVMARDTAGIMP
jgi:hypothetical protein